MQNSQWQWVPWVVGLIGGGAMGAIITAIVTKMRQERQPVYSSVEILNIFKRDLDFPSMEAHITLAGDSAGPRAARKVDNLSVARIWLHNAGNQDIENFKFGITLDEKNEAIAVESESIDRHHSVNLLTPVSLEDRKANLDFSLSPFNRGDSYWLNVKFIYEGTRGKVRLSSPHATVFKVIEERQNNTVDTIKNVINDPEIAWLITKVVVMIFLGTFMFVAYRGIRSKIESMSKTSSPPAASSTPSP
jgi:hypothetical protein